MNPFEAEDNDVPTGCNCDECQISFDAYKSWISKEN
jgi:hypothetical protein